MTKAEREVCQSIYDGLAEDWEYEWVRIERAMGALWDLMNPEEQP